MLLLEYMMMEVGRTIRGWVASNQDVKYDEIVPPHRFTTMDNVWIITTLFTIKENVDIITIAN